MSPLRRSYAPLLRHDNVAAGQALAYEMGELKPPGAAHDALGARFDVRAFHDAVIENGGVPFFILEKQISEYIAAAQKK